MGVEARPSRSHSAEAGGTSRQRSLRILAVVPGPFCFGLQNVSLAIFAGVPRWVQCHFLNTYWTDGEFDRRLDALGMPRSSTWFGMFSRKLDRKNVQMTLGCVRKLPTTWRDFFRLYRSFRPDLIFVANNHETILLLPILIWVRRKVVCHMHDPPPPIFFQKLLFAIWRRAISRFIFISDNVRDRMQLLGHFGTKDMVIHNGVEITPLSQPRRRKDNFCELFGWPRDSIIFGITGQIGQHKGHEDFLAAALLAQQSNPKTRFVIGGRGDGDFLERLRAFVADRCMQGYVGFCGWLSHPNEFYEGVDALVLPSRHDEGFGLVVAEAGERGIPVIATRSGGATEILMDSQTGLFVEKNDAQSVADAIIRLAADGSLREQMGRCARERVEANFNLRVQTEKFFDYLYRSAQASPLRD